MGQLSELFRAFGPEYLATHQDGLPAAHRKVLQALMACRTDTCGVTGYACSECGEVHRIFCSCGNRHCPQCQHHKSRAWLNTRLQRALPGHHFLLTFTVPEALRPFMRSHQRAAYAALFQASAGAIKTLARDARHLGGDLPGFFGVLHTWGRQLTYHPHIHYVVPGGALSTQDGTWHPSRVDFYLPVRALSQIYRGKFRDAMRGLGLFDAIPQDVWTIDWNVNCQAVGASEAPLKYLAPYVFRVAISESRIVRVEGRTVWFHYRKPGSRRLRTMALDVMEFIRRFLQHVLPAGFMKIRYYGFMNPNTAIAHEQLSALIELAYGFAIGPVPGPECEPLPPLRCPQCGGRLVYRWTLRPCQRSP
jgi:Putative transposase/Transposase zinc-binding domain